MVVNPPVRWLRGNIPGGNPGNRRTVAVMHALALEGMTHPDVYLRARSLVRDVLPYDDLGELEAVQQFVRDQIRYTRDPLRTEAVQRPDLTLAWGTGDCDDKATLLGSMLGSVGTPWRFVMLATSRQRPGQFSHVYAEGYARGVWVPLETIVPGAPIGWVPPGYRREVVAP